MIVGCVDCAARVDAADDPPRPTRCVRCYARASGDYPGRTVGDPPPSSVADLFEIRGGKWHLRP